jgi:hypothetical protein
MHHAILQMTAEPLRLFLETGASKVPASTQLLASLDMSDRFMSKMSPSHTDIQRWTVLPGDVLSLIGQSIHVLIYLDSIHQPPFTYGLIEYGIQLFGTKSVLKRLLQELHHRTGSQEYGTSLDIIAAIICSGTKPNLRSELRLDYSQLAKLLKQDRGLSETVVRLHRRVESLTVLPQEQGLSLGTNLADLDMQNVATENPEIDIRAMGGVEDQPQDINAVIDAAAVIGQMDQTNMGDSVDDVFGVQDDDMAMMNFDDLDMDGMF